MTGGGGCFERSPVEEESEGFVEIYSRLCSTTNVAYNINVEID